MSSKTLTSTSHPLRVDWIRDPRAEWLGLTLAPGRGGSSESGGGRWRRDLDADLDRLVNVHEASVLVCLLEDHELDDLGIPYLLDRARIDGLEVLEFPIRDGSIPSSTDAVAALVHRILGYGQDGRRVVVHCRAGLGRSGTIVGCCLAALGFDAPTILRRLREDRSPRCPENEMQREFIRDFTRKGPHLVAAITARKKMEETMALIDHVPEGLREVLDTKSVRRASFAAGPSFAAGKVEVFDPLISFFDGMAWLDRFSHVFRKGHLSFEDGSGLWVERDGLCRFEEKPHEPPLPGIILKDSEGNGREE